MNILYYLLFLFVGMGIGAIIAYIIVSNRYGNKKNIDKCFNERKKLSDENQKLTHTLEEKEKNIENLKKELESTYREITEKNKYLSEDKVVIERLKEVKELSDKIGEILLDYDKKTIEHLLEEYKKGSFDDNDEEEYEKEGKEKGKKW